MNETYPQTLRRPVMQYNIPEKKRERIKTWMVISMIVVALFVDLITLIPIIAWSASAAAYVGFFIWFKMRGVSFTKNPKNFMAFGVGAIVEFFLSFLPSFTASVVAIIIFTKAEDKGGLIGKAANMAQGKAT